MKMMPTLIPTFCGADVVVDMALASVERIIQLPQQKIEGGLKDGVLVGGEIKRAV